MIILPDTPPNPTEAAIEESNLSVDIVALRCSISNEKANTHTDLVKYVINLEEYLEKLIYLAASHTKSTDPKVLSNFMINLKLATVSHPPWTGLHMDGPKELNKLTKTLRSKNSIVWNLYLETQMVLLSLSFIYTHLGGLLINELIEIETDKLNSSEDQRWKQVIVYYRKSISFLKFWEPYSNPSLLLNINPVLFKLLEKINLICIQMSVTSKYSSMNRSAFQLYGKFTTENNATLCRVAIYCKDEISNCKKVLAGLAKDTNQALKFPYEKWLKYLSVIDKYIIGYAGFFFSIEKYQQDQIGDAIGLINFSLLALQSKNIQEIASHEKSNLVSKIKRKARNFKYNQYIKNLQSITTLDLEESMFSEKSGIVLKDISYLFDQLISMHLKLSKENDNLKFDKPSIWKNINADSKWPLGSSIPSFPIEPYSSKAIELFR